MPRYANRNVEMMLQKLYNTVAGYKGDCERDVNDSLQSEEFITYSKGKVFAYKKALNFIKGHSQIIRELFNEERAKRQAAEQEVERLRTAMQLAWNHLAKATVSNNMTIMQDEISAAAGILEYSHQAALATPQDISAPKTGDLSTK
jgi:hypothetical protein